MCAIERAVMDAYDKTSIQINRCKRILALVDTYVETETASARTDLRKALMEEFEAPAIAPPVATGSVDTPELSTAIDELLTAFNTRPNAEHYPAARGKFIAHIDAWGARQREAGRIEQKKITAEYSGKTIFAVTRAEKAEADLAAMKKLMRRFWKVRYFEGVSHSEAREINEALK